MKALRPIVFLAALMLVVGLACSALSGGNTPAQPPATQAPVNNPPTTAPQPTVAPTEAPTEVATEAATATEPPAPEAQQFFTEEFDSPLSSDWSTYTVTGSNDADPDKVTLDAKDGKLVWNFDSKYVYYYLFYDPYQYDDVQLDVRADNRGRNNNSISLVCRYEENVGWYEFNIANNGLYSIIYADVSNPDAIDYQTITNGGSNSIKQGKDVNEYTIICRGDKLTLKINGDEVKTISEKKYGLRSGKAGVSVSSFDVLPITIEMDWIKISQP
jgi:hypothetical protein